MIKGVPNIMVPETTDTKALRKYLLGDLPPEDQEAFDLWLMSEDAAYDLVQAAEDDLIDEFLTGGLSPTESEHFCNHFLVAPERQRKVQFARVFREYADTIAVPIPAARPAATPSFWQELSALFRHQPAFGLVSVALILLMVGGSVWTGVTSMQLQDRLDSVSTKLNDVETQRLELQRQLAETEATRQQLTTQLALMDQAVSQLRDDGVAGGVLALSLNPIMTRSAPNLPIVQLTPATRVIQFSLPLPEVSYPGYSVVLVDDGGVPLDKGPRLTARSTDDKEVVVNLPAKTLLAGTFGFKLTGITNSKTTEDIAEYYFRVR